MMWYEKLWYGNSPWALALVPFSAIYQAILAARNGLYRIGLFRQHRVAVPVIVVGNLTVGGTGKTPLVIALANQLKAQGERPGIVSRGYGGRSRHYPLLVSSDTKADEAGDEPLIIDKHTGCPVMVDPNRVHAAKALLAQTDCTLIISDDGLQHKGLARDIEILLIDGQRRFGNNRCLPAGPLREPSKRAELVDFIVSSGALYPNASHMNFEYGALTNLLDPAKKFPEWGSAQPVFAITGIGNPERFFNALQNQGFKILKQALRDHHRFTPADFAFTESQPVIMTEKDAVKCQDFAQPNWWYLPVSATLPTEFWMAFSQKWASVKKGARVSLISDDENQKSQHESGFSNLAPRDGLEPPTK